MTDLQPSEIKKLKRGELVGNIATGFCGVVLIYFIVGFAVAFAYGFDTFKIIVSATAGGLIAAGIGLAVYCSFRFGGALDKLIENYVLNVFVENAEKMHPERDSLTFYMDLENTELTIKVNNFKEKIVFDFSAFGKLSPMRRMNIFASTETRLICTFIRLWDRGAKLKDVSYAINGGNRRRNGKTFPIIENGQPEKRSMKIYLRNR